MSNSDLLDMTKGKPLSLIIKFAIPLTLGSFFQQLYSFVDTAIVGRCISVEALSAVGITSPLNFFVLGFTIGSAAGFCIPISQSVGAKNEEAVSCYFWNGLYLSFFLALVISLGSFFLVRPLLLLINTPGNLLEMASVYLSVIFSGQLVTALYNYLAGVIRAYGDSKRPFYFLLFSCGVNVVLDLLLVQIFPLGVAGAAWATVISQGLSVLLCVWWLFKKTDMIQTKGTDGKELNKLSGFYIKKICIIGIPLGLEASVCSIGNIILQGAINTLGEVAAAAQVCAERIRFMFTLPMESVGTAMATYVGQNYGAHCIDRIKSGVRSGLLIQTVYSACAWGVLFILKRPLVYLLLGSLTTPEASATLEYLSIISTLFVFHGSLMIFRYTIQGMGFGIAALISSVMEIIGRSAAGFLAVYLNSFPLICLSSPMAWILAMLYCAALYTYYIRRESQKAAVIKQT